jgi:capsule polysaccharide export protein KpsC/LpsZ
MTSLLGFEALIRGVPVTCLGAPFYAGYGLTRDLGPVPDWRRPTDLTALAHAALIAYPRYWDPVSRRPCPPEVALDRLASGDHAASGARQPAAVKGCRGGSRACASLALARQPPEPPHQAGRRAGQPDHQPKPQADPP